MPVYTDQIGNSVKLEKVPQRVISLVPSQTEFLFDMGLDNEIVGVTKFCIHPAEKTKTKAITGGTKNLRFEVIEELKPDLIIANKEENTRIGVQSLMQNYPVWTSDVKTLEDSYEMMTSLGEIFQKEVEVDKIVTDIKNKFDKLRINTYPSSVLYLIWREPYMSIGNDTLIHDILKKGGFASITADYTRYPEINLDEIKKKSPDFIFLSSEPYPFTVKYVEELREKTGIEKIVLVDGEKFSWYGSRLAKTADYILNLRNELGLN